MIKITSLILLFTLVGCSSNQSTFPDLENFLNTSQKRPDTNQEKDSSVKDFTSFTYSALKLRSPFEIPKLFVPPAASVISSIKPDLNRIKQPLESFSLDQIKMVGNFNHAGMMWALIRVNGSIYRVKKGDYLGKNHGLIQNVFDDRVEFMELIPVGTEAWIERNTTLTLTSIPKIDASN